MACHEEYPLLCISVPQRKGKDVYHSSFITKRDPFLSLCEHFRGLSMLTENVLSSPTTLCDFLKKQEVAAAYLSQRPHAQALQCKPQQLEFVKSPTTRGNVQGGPQSSATKGENKYFPWHIEKATALAEYYLELPEKELTGSKPDPEHREFFFR